jgi:hypothetical protein
VELDILRRREKSSWSASSGFIVGRDMTACGELLLEEKWRWPSVCRSGGQGLMLDSVLLNTESQYKSTLLTFTSLYHHSGTH